MPLDPHYPQRRLAFMLEDSHVPVLLTQQRLFHLLPTFATRIVCVDTDEEIIGCTGAADLANQEYTNDVAYVIYTSGSTGQPKGVMCSHKGALNLLNDMQRQRPILAGDACSLWTSFSFDVSVYEIFSALMVGGALHITPERVRTDGSQFVEWLHAQQICSAYIPPFMLTDFREWLSRKMRKLSLHRLLVGVEPIQEQLLVEINSYLPDMHIFNGYGPTEAAICSTLYSIKASGEERRSTPIGTPVQNAQIYLLDDQLQPVPLRVPGELYIGGEGLAYGYFNRPDLTAEKFLPHPFSSEPGSRLYKTGDLARYLPDGNLEFLGRQDHQVKIRGFRVELGEIESVLSQHPSIQVAIVVAREDAIDNEQLVAYLVTAQRGTLPLLELRRYLQERLPDYMLPSFFVFLDELPVTPNGKLDRCKLPEPDPNKYEENDFVAPRDAVERALVEIWMKILQVDRIGVYDNFFALGGHSLLATRVISRIRDTFQVEISLLSFFEAPTIASLALVIAQEQAQMIGNETLSQILAELEQLSEERE